MHPPPNLKRTKPRNRREHTNQSNIIRRHTAFPLHLPKQLQRLHKQPVLRIPRNHRIPRHHTLLRHFIKHLTCIPNIPDSNIPIHHHIPQNHFTHHITHLTQIKRHNSIIKSPTHDIHSNQITQHKPIVIQPIFQQKPMNLLPLFQTTQFRTRFKNRWECIFIGLDQHVVVLGHVGKQK
ncbi:hypothetical protein HanRHA438_Chr09g0388311 [Helianthus annuus]|nr:hypothetical protein HanIR_Chr09g0406091 [Helianthus annuus]KAJ0887224.1 hypothetical protein HanRHA438_Chr09g0388311 [Helianthus annuus]